MLNTANIPKALRERRQWVLWRNVVREGTETKVPFSWNGTPAKSNDSATWCDFVEVVAVYEGGSYDGIGFMFSDADPFCGIDLDSCRNPETGEISKWAADIVRELATYAEVSPSQTGVKLVAIGSLPVRTGKNLKLPHEPQFGTKVAGIEMYDHGRYFAMTGLRVDDHRAEPEERIALVKALYDRFWPAIQSSVDSGSEFLSPQAVIERARKYLAKLPPAISGQGGHKTTFRTACILVRGFLLNPEQAMMLLQEWNQTCVPPWSERELEHKIAGARKATGRTGYLRNARPEKWATIEVPEVDAEFLAHRELVCIQTAARQYIDRLRSGPENLIQLGLPGVDEAIGGGIDLGEMVIIAGRPSHGKSAVALQCAHHLTASGHPVLFVSEEMSARAIGKRALLYASTVPQADWNDSLEEVESHLDEFAAEREKCFIVQNCSTAMAAVAEIERAVEEHQIKVAIVDYAQLLSSPGSGLYEKVTNTSKALRGVATGCGIAVIALCQLSRQVEIEVAFEPKNHHLKDSGQLEQDADVIIFAVRPCLTASGKGLPTDQFRFTITKNRNRETLAREVFCKFDAARQTLLPAAEEWR